MANSGFKGDQVQIVNIVVEATAVKGTVLKFRALFEDSDGVAHAQVTHEVAVSGEPNEFQVPTRLLLEACRSFVERMHFTEPASADEKERVRRGVAEALSTQSDTADEPGDQD